MANHLTAVLTAALIACCLVAATKGRELAEHREHRDHHRPHAPYKLPDGVEVHALVFYGRRVTFKLLNCYLESNLAVNGGLVSHVKIAVKSNDTVDLAYLDKVIARNKAHYSKLVITHEGEHQAKFDSHYDGLDKGRIYVKIDDDIVFIRPNAIELLVREKLEHSRYLFVSANVIAHSTLSHVHARLGALHAPGVLSLDAPVDDPAARREAEAKLEGANVREKTGLEFDYNPFSTCTWNNTECTAVSHQSFINHYWLRSFDSYDFQRWDFHVDKWERWSINMIVFNSSDIVTPIENHDDEAWISHVLPKRAGKHCGAVGGAIASHFSYFPTWEHMWHKTDILQRYERIAEEACGNERLVDY